MVFWISDKKGRYGTEIVPSFVTFLMLLASPVALTSTLGLEFHTKVAAEVLCSGTEATLIAWEIAVSQMKCVSIS